MIARNVTVSLLAILTAIRIQPGRKYRPSAAPLTSDEVTPLVSGEVTSSAGAVAFGGTGSQSAVGQDGLPGIKTAVWKAPLWAVWPVGWRQDLAIQP